MLAVRRSKSETLVVDGTRDEWFERSRVALERGGFSKIKAVRALKQLHGAYRKLSVWGTLDVTLLPDGESTRIQLVATGNVDNVYALFRSPSKKILDEFKSELLSVDRGPGRETTTQG